MFKTKIIRTLSQNKRILNRYERILAINDIHVDLEKILSKKECGCVYGWEKKIDDSAKEILVKSYRECKQDEYYDEIDSGRTDFLVLVPFIFPAVVWFKADGVFLWAFVSVMYTVGRIALEKDFKYCCGKDLDKYREIIMNEPKKHLNEEARVKSLVDKIGAERDKN